MIDLSETRILTKSFLGPVFGPFPNDPNLVYNNNKIFFFFLAFANLLSTHKVLKLIQSCLFFGNLPWL